MKIGVISDIHSNIVALREVIATLEKSGCEEYFLLGDFISDTPYTRETMNCLYDFIENNTCYSLKGNREEYMLAQKRAVSENHMEDLWRENSASGNLLFTYRQLTEEDFCFFESLPTSFVYQKDGYPGITCGHGSPDNCRELLQLDGDNTRKWLEKIDTDYLICAHTHYPGSVSENGKYYFNPGCVGIAIDSIGYAQCMIIESVMHNGKMIWQPIFLNVPYDYRKVVCDIKNSGLLAMGRWYVNSNIKTFVEGIDVSAEMVELAVKLSMEDGEKSKWPNIEEKYFQVAAKEYGIKDYCR